MKQDKLTDKALVEKVLSGDANAFKFIISNTQRLVLQIIYKMIKSQEDREDMAQEVYLKVYNKLSGFKHNSRLSTWIGAITYNTCLSYLEKKRIAILDIHKDQDAEPWKMLESHSSGLSKNNTETYIYKKESSHIMQLEIEKLTPLYKTIVTLYHNEELSYKEISQITNLPEGTVKSYLYRARKKLKDSLLNNYKKEDL